MTNLAALNEQFGLAPQLVFKIGPGGLSIAEINNDEATVTVVLQGGHVLSFQPRGQQHPLPPHVFPLHQISTHTLSEEF
jgi:hypothetical protein